jgi:hypothetical protein
MKDTVRTECPEHLRDPAHTVNQQPSSIFVSISRRRKMWGSAWICKLYLFIFKAQDL